MFSSLDRTFFRFLLGFLVVLIASFGLIWYVSSSQSAPAVGPERLPAAGAPTP